MSNSVPQIINKTGDRDVQADVKIKGPPSMDNFTEEIEIPVNRTEGDDVGGWIGSTRITVFMNIILVKTESPQS